MPVKGPKGELSRTLHPDMSAERSTRTSSPVARPSEEKRHKALHGLTRTLVQNMVEGVSKGFAKTLEIQGVGYKAEAEALRREPDRRALAPGQVRGPQGDQDLGREQHDS